MGFLGFGSTRKKCIKRCEGWFPNNLLVREGCQGACKENHKIMNAPEDYLCSDQLGPDQKAFVLQFGYDPCPGDEITTDSIYDDDAVNNKNQNNAIIFLVIVIVVLLFFAFKK